MWQLILSGTKDVLELIETQFATNAQAIILAQSADNQIIWFLTVISKCPIDLSLIENTDIQAIIFNDWLPEKDWLAENRASFKPIIIDPFCIHPSSYDDQLPSHKINLCIDASTAFGTGHHETTSGCLEALVYLERCNFKPNHFLDVGTGTGILAMAAARLFNINGVATDNDPEAIVRIHENLKINHLSQQIYAVIDNDLSAREIDFFRPYPLIMANILLDPLVHLADTISKYLQDKGYLILSGILTTQANLLKQVYRKFNLVVVNQLIRGEWSILILIK